MARYLNTEEAQEDGYTLDHRENESRFVVEHDDKVVGYAHYTVRSNEVIDFDSTVIDESLRGTGLAKILLTRALGDEIVKNRTVAASCWFVAGYLDRHPEALAEGATYPATPA